MTGDSLKILLVDDKLMMRKIQGEILQSVGHHVNVVSSGISALEQVKLHCYDLILMDIQMPLMDGLETTKQIRDGGINTPIVALTGNDSVEERERCRHAGMDGFLAKPINLKHFNIQIQQLS
ncbi:MAG: response regulator [Thiomicrospira sp.]|uniref:response regulator n=1 Tax=Thiomicrospira sp. TaxID=935 RepID=UPI001A010E08|nr:response regulator [Thiomicrospira sp.]MBE0493509.1 response regulator [Thiomicrospira sp.]